MRSLREAMGSSSGPRLFVLDTGSATYVVMAASEEEALDKLSREMDPLELDTHSRNIEDTGSDAIMARQGFLSFGRI
jgi:hypothetical protein